MQTNEIIFSVLNVLLLVGLLYSMHDTWRRTIGLFSGAVFASSSCYHILFGEGSVDDYDAGSWLWLTNTYEVTVMTTYVVFMILYMYSSWPNHVLFVVNLVYGAYACVIFYALPSSPVLFNTLGMSLGILWCIERILTNHGSNDSDDDESSNLLA